METTQETQTPEPARRELLPFDVELRMCGTVAGMPAALRERLPFKQKYKPARGQMVIVVPFADLQLIDDLSAAGLLSNKDRNSVQMIIRPPGHSTLPAWVHVHDVPRKVPSMAQWLCDRYVRSVMDARKRQIPRADLPIFVHELEEQTTREAARQAAAEAAHAMRAANLSDELLVVLAARGVHALHNALRTRTSPALDLVESIIKEMKS